MLKVKSSTIAKNVRCAKIRNKDLYVRKIRKLRNKIKESWSWVSWITLSLFLDLLKLKKSRLFIQMYVIIYLQYIDEDYFYNWFLNKILNLLLTRIIIRIKFFVLSNGRERNIFMDKQYSRRAIFTWDIHGLWSQVKIWYHTDYYRTNSDTNRSQDLGIVIPRLPLLQDGMELIGTQCSDCFFYISFI